MQELEVKLYRRPFLVLLGPLIAAFVGVYSEAALNIALPQLMTVFNVSAAVVQWLTTGYLLMVGILLPLFGLLVRWFTTRQLTYTAGFLFILGASCSALAPTFSVLLLGRLIQGMATGILIPLIFSTAIAVYPLNRRGTAMGMIGVVVMFAPAISPVVAGLIIEYLNWTWIFWVMVPVTFVALAVSLKTLNNVRPITKPRVDTFSIALSTIGFGGLVLGVSLGGDMGWLTPIVLVSLAIGCLGIILYSKRQLTLKDPMLNVRAFGHRNFTLGALIITLSSAILFCSVFLIPMFLQNTLLLPVLVAGLLMLPGGTLNGLLSAISGRTADRFQPKLLAFIGLITVLIACVLFAALNVSSSVGWVVLAHCILMIGIPFTITPMQTIALNSVPVDLGSDGSTILSTLQQIGAAVGTALGASLLSAGMLTTTSKIEGTATGIHFGFLFTIVITCIGLLLAIGLKSQQSHDRTEAAVVIEDL